MKIVFRITLEYVKENVDVTQFLNLLGNDLFLVLHEKPNNYHYHGLLDIKHTAKTFRKKIGELLDPQVEPPKGFRPITVSDKVDDDNGYKSYCLFRPGHPVKHIHVNENLNTLKDISEKKIKPVASKHHTKLDKDLSVLLERTKGITQLYSISEQVVGYYKELGRVIHIANMQQLIWSIHTYNHSSHSLIMHLISKDEGLTEIYGTQTENEEHFKKLYNIKRELGIS